jgi:hypothetical protein
MSERLASIHALAGAQTRYRRVQGRRGSMIRSRRRLTGMVSALAITALLSLMVATTVAAKGPAVAHRVSAGGPDACAGLGLKHRLRCQLLACGESVRRRSASGQYTDRFGRIGGMKGVIDCVVVVGNQAWISGWITSGPFLDQDLTGLPFTTRVADNGTSANDPPDQGSSAHTGDETPCTDMADWDLIDVPQGQVSLR